MTSLDRLDKIKALAAWLDGTPSSNVPPFAMFGLPDNWSIESEDAHAQIIWGEMLRVCEHCKCWYKPNGNSTECRDCWIAGEIDAEEATAMGEWV